MHAPLLAGSLQQRRANSPADPNAEFGTQFGQYRPQPLSLDHDTAVVTTTTQSITGYGALSYSSLQELKMSSHINQNVNGHVNGNAMTSWPNVNTYPEVLTTASSHSIQSSASRNMCFARDDQSPSPSMTDEFRAIKENLTFLNHQITRIMKSFNVRRCDCSSCGEVEINETMKLQNNRKRTHCSLKEDELCPPQAKQIEFAQPKESSAGAVDLTGLPDEDGGKRSTSPSISTNVSDDMERDENASPQSTANEWSATATAAHMPTLKPKMSTDEASSIEMPRRGRKSKYCSASEKREVADYAQTYGATAAARKFNIPPAVAAYYHRKQFKSPRSVSTVTEEAVFFPESFTAASNFTAIERMRTAQDNTKSSSTALSVLSGVPKTQPKDLSVASERSSPFGEVLESHNNNNNNLDTETGECGTWGPALDKNGYAGGSPGFLRGRGRGRPKLIGDELDAELVEYMVQWKMSNRQHLTASHTLQIARAYIAEKSPGLLEEHGGQIKLKITWAMKLVSRIAEREREIQLGLSAGSLQNFGKNLNTTRHDDVINSQLSQNSNEKIDPKSKGNLSVLQWPAGVVPSAADASLFNTGVQAQQQSATIATLLSTTIGKLSSDQLSGATNTELLDIHAVLVELGLGSVDELTQCEPFRSLLASSMAPTAGESQDKPDGSTTEMTVTSAF